MKVAFFSDLHLGFCEGKERQGESFENAMKAFDLALSQNADLIVLAGDLFDLDVPSQETLLNAFRIFLHAKKPCKKILLKKCKNKKTEFLEFENVPIISIHGTHEFRGKDQANVLELLESVGLIVYLHAGYVEADLGGEKFFIHGLGGVPEKKALDALKLFDPKPVDGGKNVLVLHQSIKEYLPFDDEMIASISLADLPNGFDLIVNGHLHWNALEDLGGKKFLLTGSTIITQMKKLESGRKKCISIYDTKNGLIDFLELPLQRKMFYEKISFENAMPGEIKDLAEKKLGEILCQNFESKPLVRLKLCGTLCKGVSSSEVSLAELEKKFGQKAILSIDKDFSSIAFKEKMAELKKLQQSKKSISSIGLQILEKNISETSFGNAFDVSGVFDLLSRDELDKAFDEISKNKPKN